jgi:hypothetical protein
MAYVSKRVSDLTGVEAADSEFIELIVRQAPGLTEPIKLDVLPSEIAGLKGAGELVVIDVKNGETKQLIVTVAEWKKLAPNIDEVIANASGVRGRRKGYRPGL